MPWPRDGGRFDRSLHLITTVPLVTRVRLRAQSRPLALLRTTPQHLGASLLFSMRHTKSYEPFDETERKHAAMASKELFFHSIDRTLDE